MKRFITNSLSRIQKPVFAGSTPADRCRSTGEPPRGAGRRAKLNDSFRAIGKFGHFHVVPP
jgi:hypothetical protein